MEYKLNEYQQEIYDTHIEHKWQMKIGRKTTVVVLRMKNGFEVVGSSACVNVEDFNYVIGEHFAMVDALEKIGSFLAFAKQNEPRVEVAEVKEQIVFNPYASVSISKDDFTASSDDISDDFAHLLVQKLKKVGNNG